MKPNDMRAEARAYQERVQLLLDRNVVPNAAEATAELVRAMWEIAAQLAEANQHTVATMVGNANVMARKLTDAAERYYVQGDGSFEATVIKQMFYEVLTATVPKVGT